MLALRVTLLWVTTASVAFTLQAWLHLDTLNSVLTSEARHDLKSLSSAVSSATAAFWQKSGKDAALRYVSRVNQRWSQTQITFGEAPAQTTSVRTSSKQALAESAGFSREETPRTLRLVTPVVLASGETVGRLNLSRDLSRSQHLVRMALMRRMVFIVIALVAILIFSYFVGQRYITRPVAVLAEKARQVSRGDQVKRSSTYSKTEIGFLDRELDHMIDALDTAREKVSAERFARTEALERLRHADRLSTVGKTASGVAHELGTPLNVISGRASMILMDDKAGEEIANHAKIIEAQTQHMTAIIQQLLAFSRKRAPQNEEVDVRDLLSSAVQLIEPLAHKRDTDIHVTVPEGLRARLDSGKTMQVLTNLMVNGIQAMKEGGELRLGAKVIPIEQPADKRSPPGTYLCMSVADTGKGIPQDKLTRIFDSFYTTKEEGEGTGLGLSICQEIVQEQFGFIEVESVVGVGSEFRVCLPTKDTDISPGESKDDSRRKPYSGYR